MALMQQNGTLYATDSAADLSAKLYYAAKIDTSGNIALAGAGAVVAGIITEGAVQNKASTIQCDGIAKVILGGTVAAGAAVAADSNGKAVTAASAAYQFGIALEGGDAGEIVPVLLKSGRAAA